MSTLEHDDSVKKLPARSWKEFGSSAKGEKIAQTLRIATFNVLSEGYQTGRGGLWELWENRKERLLEEILLIDADVVCLQEVDHYDFFQMRLEARGYHGIWIPKTKRAQERRVDPDDGTVVNFDEFSWKYRGQYTYDDIKWYWDYQMVACQQLPTEGQAIFVKHSTWKIQAKCCWTCFDMRRSSGLKKKWVQWIDSPDLLVFDEGAVECLAPSLFTKDKKCPLPQVALGVVVSPTNGGASIGILNLHIKSSPRELSKLGLSPESVKFEQLKYFIDRAQNDLVQPSSAIGLVVCGDLNQTLSQEHMQDLRLLDTHLGMAWYRSPIDYILLQQPCRLQIHETLSVPNKDDLGSEQNPLPNEVYPSDRVARAATIAFDIGAESDSWAQRC